MKKVFISIVSPAIRTENWMLVYNSMLPSDVSFEVLFAGPIEPKFKLPFNMRYIRTSVKPAQCWEILFHEAKGKYIMFFADDMIFETKKPLNIISKELNLISKKKQLLGMNYAFREKIQTNDMTFKINNNKTVSALLPMCPPIEKKIWLKYGRFDKRFISTLLEADFFLRLINDGYKIKKSKVKISEKQKLEDCRKMSRDYLRIDRKLMMKLWTKKHNKEEYFVKKRNDMVQNFNLKTIYKISENPSGRWSNNNWLYNKFITSKFFYEINFYYYFRKILSETKHFLINKFSYKP